MNFWFLLQIFFDLVVIAGVVGVWMRLNKPAKDDPRLSKGLQLLQSKIAVLEDLSDRTEVQVNQLTALLEQKCKDIQIKIQAAEKQLVKIDQSTQRSLEVAKIFQDRIPHTEILERQNTIKYVKAARLAHQGLSIDEIVKQVDLSRGEIEFIAKVNKDQLMFCEDSLPEWVQDDEGASAPVAELATLEMPGANPFQISRDLSGVFEIPKSDQTALKKLGEAFKSVSAAGSVNELNAEEDSFTEIKIKPGTNLDKAMNSADSAISNNDSVMVSNSTLEAIAAKLGIDSSAFLKKAADVSKTAEEIKPKTAPELKNEKNPNIRPVEFRRIEMTDDLG